jgi:cytochrome c oxidase assembly protein subunit 11
MQKKNTKKTAGVPKIFIIIPVLMFGFAFALVPIYNVFCASTGLNGKVMLETSTPTGEVDESRLVTMEFSTTLNESLAWDFEPKTVVLQVHPGQIIDTAYLVKNLTPNKMTVQAIPSITPAAAAKHLKKIECFCFEHQDLDGQCAKEMPLTFFLDPKLPKDIHRVTLSYTLFDITDLIGKESPL